MQDCENDAMAEESKRALNETSPEENDERETSYGRLSSRVRVESASSQRIGTIASSHSIVSFPKLQSTVRLQTTKAIDEQNKDTFGFVNGDFKFGKILDLPVQRCFIMAYSVVGDLLAVGSNSEGGIALYETQTYSLVHVVERNDVVSALQWLQLPDGRLFLASGGLDGVSTLYSIESDLLELQGATVTHEFRLAAQVRTMTLSKCDDDLILWIVGDKSGTVTLCCFPPHDPQSIQKTEYSYSAGILGLAVNAAVTLLAISTKAGEVIVERIMRNKDNSLSLDGNVYTVQRRGPVRSIVFTKDQRRLVFGGYDKMVVVVDTKLWAITRELNVQGTVRTVFPSIYFIMLRALHPSKISNESADQYAIL
jgi:WD40 repeat protein